jgi:hypothetical protein
VDGLRNAESMRTWQNAQLTWFKPRAFPNLPMRKLIHARAVHLCDNVQNTHALMAILSAQFMQ